MVFPKYYALNGPAIIVDDSDPAIEYNGTWNAANETVILGKTFSERVPIFNTLHVLQIFNGSISYEFTGGGISVFATPFDDSNYTSECILDGNHLNFDPAAAKPQFGQSRPVCQAFGLPDTTVHKISVIVSVPPREFQITESPLSGFAFDYILVQPVSGMSPWENGTQDILLPVLDLSVVINSTTPTEDTSIVLANKAGQKANFTRGWDFDAKNGFHTSTPGSQANVTFTGTSLWWYGYYQAADLDLSFSSGTFSVDGGAPLDFSGTESPSQLSASQALIFKTPVLEYSTHLLTVVYHGNNTTLPLTLQSLVVQRLLPTISTPNSTMVVVPSTSMPKLPVSSLTTQHKGRGGILGAIFGGVVFLLIISSGICILIGRTKRGRRSMQAQRTHLTSLTPEPFAITSDETIRVLVPRKAQQGQQNLDNPIMPSLQGPPVTKWTRRQIVSHGSGPAPNSSAASIHGRGPADPGVNAPFTHSYSDTRPPNRDSADIRPEYTQIDDASFPTMTNSIISPSPPLAHAERDEDSGLRMASLPILPPFYTAH